MQELLPRTIFCDEHTIDQDQQKHYRLHLYLAQEKIKQAMQAEAKAKIQAWANEQELAWYVQTLLEDTSHRMLKLAEHAPLETCDEQLTCWWHKIMECQNYAYYCQTHKAEIMKQARHILKSTDLAEDLYQEIVLELLMHAEKKGSYPPIKNLAALLKTLVKNRALNAARNIKNHDDRIGGSPLLFSQLSTVQEALDAPGQPLKGNILFEDPFSLLRSSIASMKQSTYRSVLMHHLIDGYTVPEIAKLLGRRLQTVKNDLYRGHHMLREAYFTLYPQQQEKLLSFIKLYSMREEEQNILKMYFLEGKDAMSVYKALLKKDHSQNKNALKLFVQATLEKWKEQLNRDMMG